MAENARAAQNDGASVRSRGGRAQEVNSGRRASLLIKDFHISRGRPRLRTESTWLSLGNYMDTQHTPAMLSWSSPDSKADAFTKDLQLPTIPQLLCISAQQDNSLHSHDREGAGGRPDGRTETQQPLPSICLCPLRFSFCFGLFLWLYSWHSAILTTHS